MAKNKFDDIQAKKGHFSALLTCIAGLATDALTLGGTAITATAAQINTLAGAAFDRSTKTARVALAAADTAGGVFAWVNPEATAIIVDRVDLDITTQSTGASTIDVGMTATSAVTLADNLIDGLSMAAAGVFSNAGSAGTNGKQQQKVAVGKWVTGSVASGASAGLVGYAYIRYRLI